MVLITENMEDSKTEPEEAKTQEQLEKEIVKLKTRLKLTQSSLIQARSQMELQSVRTKQLISAWQTRLEDAESSNKRKREQKDKELSDISSQLFFLQGCLQKEQRRIQSILAEKDKVISKQKKKINQLKKVNAKMVDSIKTLKQKINQSDGFIDKTVDKNGYYRAGGRFANGHLDFPDVFDDSGDIRTPNNVLDLPAVKDRTRDDAGMSPHRSPRTDSAYSSIAEYSNENPNTNVCNTFPKRKPILKHSQSQGILTSTKPSFYIDPESRIEEVPQRAHRSNSIIGTTHDRILKKNGKILRQSKSQGNLICHTKPRATFYIESDHIRSKSVDFEDTLQTSEIPFETYENYDTVDYPDVVPNANRNWRQRRRSNSLHNVTYQTKFSVSSDHDLEISQGQTVRRNSLSATHHDDVFYIPVRHLPEDVSAFSRSKHKALRQKTSTRRRRRSTSEPGIEAAFAYRSYSEPKIENGESTNYMYEPQTRRRIQSVEV